MGTQTLVTLDMGDVSVITAPRRIAHSYDVLYRGNPFSILVYSIEHGWLVMQVQQETVDATTMQAMANMLHYLNEHNADGVL